MNKAYLSGVIGMLVGIIFLGAAAIDTAFKQNEDPSSFKHITIIPEEERGRISSAIAVTLSNPEVKKIIYSLDYSTKYHRLDSNRDRVTVVASELGTVEPLDGNFTNGYRQTLKERTITVDIDRMNNAVLSVKTKSTPIDVVTIKFNENQKKAIAISLADPKVQELLEGKQYYIVQVRESGVGLAGYCEYECALVGFDLVTSPRGVLMSTILNPKTGEVLDVRAGTGWSSQG